MAKMSGNSWGKRAIADPHEIGCGRCGYVSKGEIGMRLHYRVSHKGFKPVVLGLDDPRKCFVCRESFGNSKVFMEHAARTSHF